MTPLVRFASALASSAFLPCRTFLLVSFFNMKLTSNTGRDQSEGRCESQSELLEQFRFTLQIRAPIDSGSVAKN